MNYYFIGVTGDYPKHHIIHKITKFILDNPDYFGVFCDILIRARNIKIRNAMVNEIIEYYKIIKKKELNNEVDFRKLLEEFFLHEKDGRARGAAIAYLVSKIGPISFKSSPIYTLRECFVIDELDNKVGGEKKFDVCFHCNYSCVEEIKGELIESKVDLNNFIAKQPFNKECIDIDKEAFDKLEYFKIIKETLSSCNHLEIAFATARYDNSLSERILTTLGYDTIVKIFDKRIIEQALEQKISG